MDSSGVQLSTFPPMNNTSTQLAPELSIPRPALCQPSPFAFSTPIPLRTNQGQSFGSTQSPQSPFSPGQNGQTPFGSSNSFAPPARTPSGRVPSYKYHDRGYQELSKRMASDKDFFVVRQFKATNALVVLYMQDRIVQMEERLKEIHEKHPFGRGPMAEKNGSFRWDLAHEKERDAILCELSGLIHHYNQYVNTLTRIGQRPSATDRQIENLEEYFEDKTIAEKEREYIKQRSDLISIKSSPSSFLGSIVEGSSLIARLPCLRAKPDPGQLSDDVHYTSDNALANLTTGTIIFLGCGMLLGPMWALENITNSQNKLWIITAFVVAFMLFMGMASVHRPFEVVTASAAYAAVLMVFMQIDGKGGQPPLS